MYGVPKLNPSLFMSIVKILPRLTTKKVPDTALHECGACHDNLSEHRDEPAKITPSAIKTMDKTKLNTMCGKCHYSKDILGSSAINPEQ
jgi:hypothetical protein